MTAATSRPAAADPSSRLWTMLLATVNVGILAAISLVTAVILR